MNSYNWLNDKEFEALKILFRDCNDAFIMLPGYWKKAFYDRIHEQLPEILRERAEKGAENGG